jgi:hypothetical protein
LAKQDVLVESDSPESSRIAFQSPPYDAQAVRYLKKFIEVAKALQISLVDNAFLTSNRITDSKREYVLTKTLRFLDIIDDEGKPTPKLAWLRVVGQDYRTNTAKIVQEAYADAISKVAISIVGPDALRNYFVNSFDYTQTQAEGATRFFVWIANEGSLELSPELKEPLSQQAKTVVRAEKNEKPPKARRLPEREEERSAPQDISSIANVQTNVSMTLDKDTPLEIWKLVLDWLSKRQDNEL